MTNTNIPLFFKGETVTVRSTNPSHNPQTLVGKVVDWDEDLLIVRVTGGDFGVGAHAFSFDQIELGS